MCIRDRWLPYPDEVMALLPQLWSDGVTRDGDGALAVAGVSATELARDFGTPAYVCLLYTSILVPLYSFMRI